MRHHRLAQCQQMRARCSPAHQSHVRTAAVATLGSAKTCGAPTALPPPAHSYPAAEVLKEPVHQTNDSTDKRRQGLAHTPMSACPSQPQALMSCRACCLLPPGTHPSRTRTNSGNRLYPHMLQTVPTCALFFNRGLCQTAPPPQTLSQSLPGPQMERVAHGLLRPTPPRSVNRGKKRGLRTPAMRPWVRQRSDPPDPLETRLAVLLQPQLRASWPR